MLVMLLIVLAAMVPGLPGRAQSAKQSGLSAGSQVASAPARSIFVTPFAYDGLSAELFEPVYAMMSDLSRLQPEGQFCAEYDPACQLDRATYKHLTSKIPGTPVYLEEMTLKRLSELVLFPLVASHDKSLLNYAARKGYLRTYGQVLRRGCVAEAEMGAYLQFLGALAWRARGGGLYNKTGQFSGLYRRIFGWEAWRVMARRYGLDRQSADQFGQLMFEGLKEPWGEWIDVGRAKRPINKNAHTGTIASDFQNLRKRGRRLVAGPVDILAARGANPRPLWQAGDQMGACYLLAWNVYRGRPTLGSNLAGRMSPIADSPIAWGEICMGASLAFGMTHTLAANYQCKAD